MIATTPEIHCTSRYKVVSDVKIAERLLLG